MAQIDVQPKQQKPVWVWIILAVVVLLILFFLVRGCGSEKKSVVIKTSGAGSTLKTAKNIAVTQPDWNTVDFKLPRSSYKEITDTAILVRGNTKYTIYGLGENILFASDQSIVQGSANGKLNEIAISLSQRFKNAYIGVYGHTDATGSAAVNKSLAAARAEAVKNWLVKHGSIDSDRISVHSLGESKPVATNATEKGRQQNRSVEIVAFPNSAGN